MTPITLPRAVVQQVRDALKGLLEEMESLHEAYNHERTQDAWDAEPEDDSLPLARAAIAALDEALAQPTPTPELPPFPEIDPAQSIPYASVRYIAGFTEDFVKQYAQAYARAALAQRGADIEAERDRYKAAFALWIEKTEWIQRTFQPRELGWHRADILRKRIDALTEAARMGLEALELYEGAGLGNSTDFYKQGEAYDAAVTARAALSAALANHPKEGGQR